MQRVFYMSKMTFQYFIAYINITYIAIHKWACVLYYPNSNLREIEM